jgi:heptosyltransferase-2
MKPPVAIPAARIVVVMPNWLGDAVMATPFLRSLRGVYPQAHLASLARPSVASICEGLTDQIRTLNKGEESSASRWMRQERFDLGVLLPNSFRTAWMLWRGGVKRRLGYSRGKRGILLTDRVKPLKRSSAQAEVDHRRAAAIAAAGGDGAARVGSRFQPIPTIDYYLTLAAYLGGTTDRRMTVSLTPQDRAAAAAARASLGLGAGPLAILVPGANFGASKCWMPERFAAVAQALADPAGPFNLNVMLAGSPGELPVCQAIHAALTGHAARVGILPALNGGKGVSIGALKALVATSSLMICNDTGPRHLAAAFAIPTVTLFGPTNPVWAETFSTCERILRVEVPCGPCQLKQCPIDHRCMKALTPEMVLAAVRELRQAPASV